MKMFYLVFTFKTKKNLYYAGLHNRVPKMVPNFKDALLYKTQKSLEKSLEQYAHHKNSPLLSLNSEIRFLDFKELNKKEHTK